jgi:uncharacterized protein
MNMAVADRADGYLSQKENALAARLPDGRLHLQEGPIDLVIGAFGAGDAVDAAYRRAIARFQGLLSGLVVELPGLRSDQQMAFANPIAQAMATAVAAHRPAFVTPMAAVAGAVADAVLAALAGPGIRRAYVNNGGDIALYLTVGESLTAAVAGTGARTHVRFDDPVRGIATSGWQGRSQSLGIADAVTVLAGTGADADAAATMIANAADLPGHPAIRRVPARAVKADSDLGGRLVTVGVDVLTQAEVARALAAGVAHAQGLVARGIIAGAALFLQSEFRTVGQMPMTIAEAAHA